MFGDDWEDFFLLLFSRFLYFWMTLTHGFVRRFNRFGDYLDKQLLKTKPYLPHVARLCILSTFIEDGFQKLVYWNAEREFMEEKWNYGWYSASLIVLFTFLGQLLPSFMLVSKKYVRISCGTLASILVLQNVTHNIPWSWTFLIPNICVGCSLWILFAVTQYEQRSKNIRADDILEKLQNQIHLVKMLFPGIILLNCIYLSFINWYYFMTSPMFFVGLTLLNLKIFVVSKRRVSGIIIVLWHFGINIWCNSLWTNDYLLKFSFFQTTSITGGLLLLVAYEIGGICFEDLLRIRR